MFTHPVFGGPSGPTIYNYSTFTGANGTNITAYTPEVGGNWTVGNGSATIQNNAWRGGIDFTNSYVDSGVSDCIVSCDLMFTAYQAGPQLMFRYVDNNNLWTLNADDYRFDLYRILAGSATVQASWSFAGDVRNVVRSCEAVLSGSSIIINIDSVQRMSISNASHQSATKHGVRAYKSAISVHDEFKVTVL